MVDNQRWFMGAYLNIVLSNVDSAAAVSIIEHKMAKGFGPPLHAHNDEDETFYILEGRFRFRVADKEVELGSGHSIHVPKAAVHTFKVLSPVGRFLTVTNGMFEDMVRAASVVAQSEDIPPEVSLTADDQAQLAIICSQNGTKFLGPPIN